MSNTPDQNTSKNQSFIQHPIHVFAMGGTIDKMYFDALSEYKVGTPQVIEIFKDAGISQQPRITRICQKDSLELNLKDRALLAAEILQAQENKILVTHGTDTMSETAQYLIEHHAELAHKTIVFVGAMKPARFKETDAPFNVGFALGALQALPQGVWIAMNGGLFPAGHVRKNRDAQCFEPNV